MQLDFCCPRSIHIVVKRLQFACNCCLAIAKISDHLCPTAAHKSPDWTELCSVCSGCFTGWILVFLMAAIQPLPTPTPRLGVISIRVDHPGSNSWRHDKDAVVIVCSLSIVITGFPSLTLFDARTMWLQYLSTLRVWRVPRREDSGRRLCFEVSIHYYSLCTT